MVAGDSRGAGRGRRGRTRPDRGAGRRRDLGHAAAGGRGGSAARARADVQRRLGGRCRGQDQGRRRRPRAGRTAPPRPPRGSSRTPRRRGRPRSPCTRPTGSPGGCSAGSGCRTTTTRSRPAGTRCGASGRPGSRGWASDAACCRRCASRAACWGPSTPVSPIGSACPGLPGRGRDDDGCASFLATGAAEPGDGVTALGSTLTLKLLSDRPVFDPGSGVYSHRLLGLWLAGGAPIPAARRWRGSSRPRRWRRSSRGSTPTGRPGSTTTRCRGRASASRSTTPRWPRGTSPGRRTTRRSSRACSRASRARRARATGGWPSLGAPTLRSVRTVGGGAANRAWARIRARVLGVPLEAARSTEAAYGTALLAARALGC